jgi:hypothetical protein
MTPHQDPSSDTVLSTAQTSKGQLTPGQKQAVIGVFEGFYSALAGEMGPAVHVNMWQGPKPIIVAQLDNEPLAPQVAQSIITMLVAILRAKPEPYARLLAEDGALEALYDIAFSYAQRLDVVTFDRLPARSARALPASALLHCCLTAEPLAALKEPVIIASPSATHLFDFGALKALWKENFRIINPMTRQSVDADTLFRLEP